MIVMVTSYYMLILMIHHSLESLVRLLGSRNFIGDYRKVTRMRRMIV